MVKLRAALFIAVLAIVPSAASLARVYVRQDCLAQGYQLSVQQQRRDTLRAQLRRAELERARGRGPAALTQMARALKLGPPRPGQNLGAATPSSRTAAPAPRSRAQSH